MADGDEDSSGDRLLRAVARAPARPPPPPQLNPGERIGGFRVIAKLGAGGMGEVYRAEDERLEREVALKVIGGGDQTGSGSGSAAHRQLLREARAAAAVNHANVATVFEVGEHEGRIFIAMELVPGRTLREMIRERKRLDANAALDISRQIASALAKAHEKGIVHRDLKPENVIVGDDETGALVKVLDFGLARIVEDNTDLTSASASASATSIAGTPAYMSPEQAAGGPIDVRTDVYALGVVLYEMLIGMRPMREGSSKHADIPPKLQAIIDRCLATDPADRFPSAKEAHDAMTREADHDERSLTKRRPWLVAAGIVIALVAIAWNWRRPRDSSSSSSSSSPIIVTTTPSVVAEPTPPSTVEKPAPTTPSSAAAAAVVRPITPTVQPRPSASAPASSAKPRHPLDDQY